MSGLEGTRSPLEGDRLPHEPNRVIIGFTESPMGTPVIGMTFMGQDWIHYVTMQAITADRVRVGLHRHFGIETLSGLPFDWRQSVARKELILFPDEAEKHNKPVGILVPADRFDELPEPSMF